MIARAIQWEGDSDGYLELIDQQKLPVEYVVVDCHDIESLWQAIKNLAVRGAPAIGVAAGYGLVLSMQKSPHDIERALVCLEETGRYLESSRPTAVNLSWAVRRIIKEAHLWVRKNPDSGVDELKERVFAEASVICEEDRNMCRLMGENGWSFITEGAGVLTHCNAGALATAGQGTALSLMFEAHRRGRKFRVFADETRPLLQGARLTAWELAQAGIDVTVVCDNMAGALMQQGMVDMVITGADRIAANGDAANKIGTYGLSILAKAHSIPLYVVAPSSTFDLSIGSGAEIPIEQRSESEMRSFGNRQIVPDLAGVYNPAFDVTPAGNIAAIVTEKGVIERPDKTKIAEHLA